jgi:uncharacterized protein
VSRSFYFDTSALIKLYHQEIGTEQVEQIFSQAENTLVISEIAIVELYSTLARKVQVAEITLQAQEETLRNFEEDCTQRFVITPLGGAVIRKAKALLQKYGSTKPLRTLDALQLAACQISRTSEELTFVCADDRLLEIATLEGLRVLDPETSSGNPV